MTGIYYPELLDVLRAAGCKVAENGTTNGWQTRARSSGGFPSPPLAVWWHHTASSTSPANDLDYMIDGSDDAPVGNMLLDRTGTYWPIAAGASNCAGKGGPATFSRGTVPLDSGNTRGWQIEVANNGVGEQWPQVQVDAYFAGSNALNAHVGNLPTDVITHNVWAPTRKVDPATAAAVEGPWKPRSCTSSGTWNLDDIRAECSRRAGAAPPRPPTPEEDDDMATAPGLWRAPNDNGIYAVYMNGASPLGYKVWLPSTPAVEAFQALCNLNGWDPDIGIQSDVAMWQAFGPVVGPRPNGTDDYGGRT